MRSDRRLLHAALFALGLVCVGYGLRDGISRAQTTCGVVQERFRYEARLGSNGMTYVEIYETRQQDCDSSAVMTSSRQETIIRDRPAKVAELNGERQALVLAAGKLQQRINDLNALP